MMKYFYTALKPGGQEVKGEIEAINEQEANRKIRELGIYPVELSLLQIASSQKERKGGRSYVGNNLMDNERILYKANIHWFIFVRGIFLIIIGIIMLLLSTVDLVLFSCLIISAGILSLSNAIIRRTTTELAITSKRIIAKFGLIRRSTTELNHKKVESFKVDQSMFGRLFGYGTVIVNGTGGGTTKVPNIVSPLEFRREAMEAIDASQAEMTV